MAEQSGFFDAHLVEGEYDRIYLSEHFAKYFASFIGNGVFGGKSNELMVRERTTPSMGVRVLSGQAWIDGYWYENTNELPLTIDNADGVLHRIDSIVVRWNRSERIIRLAVKKGTPATNPVAPVVQRDDDIYELKLADIRINAGATNVTQASITDTRLNTNVCGLVIGIVQQLDADEFGVQLESYISAFIREHDAWKTATVDNIEAWVAATKASVTQWFNKLKEDSETGVNLLLSAGEERIENVVKTGTAKIDALIGVKTTELNNIATAGQQNIAKVVSDGTANINEVVSDGQASIDSVVNKGTTDINNLVSGKTEEIDEVISDAQQRFNDVIGDLQEIAQSNDVASLAIDVSALKGDVLGLKNDNESTKGNVQNLTTDVSNLKTDNNAIKRDIASLKEITEKPDGIGTEDETEKGCYYIEADDGVKEWINPPNRPGIEYRTVERWNGNPVYQKTLYIATLPNKTIMGIEIEAGWNKIISVGGFAQSDDDMYFYPFPIIINGLTPAAVITNIEENGENVGVIVIQTNEDLTYLKGYITIKYIK